MAVEFGLKTANKPDSQEICFVADDNYERFLRERAPEVVDKIKGGDLFYHGKKVGSHRGIPFYTIGQRKGLGVTLGKPVYVKEIDPGLNSVEIGDKEELLETICVADELNYVSRSLLRKGEIVFGKIRYSDRAAQAEVIESDEKSIKIRFKEAKNAITPGQSLVLYDELGFLLAGGIIRKNRM